MARCRTVNVLRACLTSVLLLALMAAPVLSASAQDAPQSAGPAPESSAPAAEPLPQRVLFIGNSHTSRHGGLDWLIENMVAAEDPPRTFDGSAVTEGGVTLEYHWENGVAELIRDGGFDVVVLQGYLPGAPTPSADTFLEYARLLDAVITASGARTVFFMTWPRGFNDWSTFDDVMMAHRQISAELDAPVAPAALAFEMARAERPELALIGDDQVHATWEGAYLAAATVYATLFDKSPEGLAYSFGVSEEDAAFLQRIAWEALSEWKADAPEG